MTRRTASRVSLGLGVLSMLAVMLAMMALQDIYHGESDLTWEWRIVRIAFLVILAFHVFALAAAWKGFNQPNDAGHPN